MEKNTRIINKFPKIRKKPKFFLKDFLRYFFDFKQEDNIDDWIEEQNKKMFKKILDIALTGSFIFIALFPFSIVFTYFTGFSYPLRLLPIVIVSYGLLWDAWETIYERIVSGRVRSNSAFPKR